MMRVGKHISRQRISRLMKDEGIVCKTRRRFKATTNSRHNKPVADNTLDRDFQRAQPNQAYVGDMTYVPTREGWLYLSVFIDMCSRAVVGWPMSDRMTATLVTDSLEMALWKRRPLAGLLVHSDRGSQYVSDRYQQLFRDNGFICSRRGKRRIRQFLSISKCFITVRESTQLMATWHRSCMNKNLPRQRKKVSGKVLPYQSKLARNIVNQPWRSEDVITAGMTRAGLKELIA